MPGYRIYYMTPDSFLRFTDAFMYAAGPGDPRLPTIRGLRETHRFIAEIAAPDKDAAYRYMQGENWSPNGEARSVIERAGVAHTSMSVGDVLQEVTSGKYFVVAPTDFFEIT